MPQGYMQSLAKMNKIGLIGGSRLPILTSLVITHQTQVKTPYGAPSSDLSFGLLEDKEVVFISRRGEQDMELPPHKINFRANIWALRDAGVDAVIATTAVSGIHPECSIGTVVLPHQLIDYTFGRENTFFGDEKGVRSIEFSNPYSEALRDLLLKTAKRSGFKIRAQAVYGITQGPRLETQAEIKRLAQDGCDIVGMTGMPEAALARELGLEYISLALVAGMAAGCENVIDQANSDALLQESSLMIEQLVEQIILS